MLSAEEARKLLETEGFALQGKKWEKAIDRTMKEIEESITWNAKQGNTELLVYCNDGLNEICWNKVIALLEGAGYVVERDDLCLKIKWWPR